MVYQHEYSLLIFYIMYDFKIIYYISYKTADLYITIREDISVDSQSVDLYYNTRAYIG